MPSVRPLPDCPGLDRVFEEYAGLAVPLLRPETIALASAARNGEVQGWAVFDGEGPCALGALVCSLRGTRAEISFIHVMRAVQGQGLEESLVAGAVSGLRAGGLGEAFCDCAIAGDPGPVRRAFQGLGTEALAEEFPKTLMAADPVRGTRSASRVPSGFAIVAWDHAFAGPAAAVVHRAHAARKDRHRESPDLGEALKEVTATTRLPGFNAGASSVAVSGGTGGEVRGVALVTSPGSESAFLTEMAVDPACQGRGLGTALVSRTLLRCREQARSCVYLVVSDGNAPATGLYRKCAFRSAMPLLSYRLSLCPAAP
jgi:ribosomal protein S18 acetylase RimI-like enzyme